MFRFQVSIVAPSPMHPFQTLIPDVLERAGSNSTLSVICAIHFVYCLCDCHIQCGQRPVKQPSCLVTWTGGNVIVAFRLSEYYFLVSSLSLRSEGCCVIGIPCVQTVSYWLVLEHQFFVDVGPAWCITSALALWLTGAFAIYPYWLPEVPGSHEFYPPPLFKTEDANQCKWRYLNV